MPRSRPLAAQATDTSGFERVVLTAGRSTVLNTPFDVTRIAVTNPAVADAVVVQPREVLIDGKSAGTVSLIVWGGDRAASVRRRGRSRRDDAPADVSAALPGRGPSRRDERREHHPDRQRVEQRRHAARGRDRRRDVEQDQRHQPAAAARRLREPAGDAPGAHRGGQPQAVQELGVNFFSTRPGCDGPRDHAAVLGARLRRREAGGLVFGDFLNLFFFNRTEGLGVAIKALEQKGLFQSLAEPNLIAYNGQEASFLAGGEFPVPVVQGATGTVTIMFKEFGVRLTFKPTIAGDVIRLKVRPEVSSLDFNNGITLEGFRIPALITRRAETDVELRDGQSFAIAGLLNNITQNDGANVPFLSKIPIIGYLFKSNADRKERTELMVLVTPRLVRPLNPDEVPPLPTQPGRFLPAPDAPTAKSAKGGK